MPHFVEPSVCKEGAVHWFLFQSNVSAEAVVFTNERNRLVRNTAQSDVMDFFSSSGDRSTLGTPEKACHREEKASTVQLTHLQPENCIKRFHCKCFNKCTLPEVMITELCTVSHHWVLNSTLGPWRPPPPQKKHQMKHELCPLWSDCRIQVFFCPSNDWCWMSLSHGLRLSGGRHGDGTEHRVRDRLRPQFHEEGHANNVHTHFLMTERFVQPAWIHTRAHRHKHWPIVCDTTACVSARSVPPQGTPPCCWMARTGTDIIGDAKCSECVFCLCAVFWCARPKPLRNKPVSGSVASAFVLPLIG